MPEDQGPEVFVYLLPALVPEGALRGGVAVVVDVLRATTAIVHALAAGCAAVVPCLEIDEARRLAATCPPGTALLAGERHGLPIDGFDLGNSPRAFTAAVCKGKTVVMTTTNGTRAVLAALEADRVVIGAFPNFAATVQLLHADGRPIHVLCAGTDGRISFEDTLLAGALAKHFKDLGSALGNDEAEIAAGVWTKIEDAVWQKSGDREHERNPLVRYLARGRGGKRVTELGLTADIEAAGRLNGLVPQKAAELRRDPLRIVNASEARS